MMKRICLVSVMCILVTSLVVVICPKTQSEAKEETVIIGGVYPLTGTQAVEALMQSRGAQLAIEEVNAAGGIKGKKVELLIRDDEFKPEVGVRRAEELVSLGAVAIAGTLGGPIAQAINAWCKNKNIPFMLNGPFVSTASTDSLPHKKILGPGTFAAWICPQNVTWQVGALIKEKGWKKWYIQYPENPYGISSRDACAEVVKANGGTVLGADIIPYSASVDYGPFLTKVLSSGADVLMNVNLHSPLVAALKDIKGYGVLKKMGVLIPYAEYPMLKGAGPEATQGIYFGMTFFWGLDLPYVKEFSTKFTNKFKEPPSGYAAYAYTQTKELVRGLNGAKSFKGTDLGDYLMANPTFVGFSGTPAKYMVYHAPVIEQYLFIGKGANEMQNPSDVVKLALKGGNDVKYMPDPKGFGY